LEAGAASPKRIDPGRVISETFAIYRDNFGALVIAALIVFVIAGILQGLLSEVGNTLGSLLSQAVNLTAIAIYTGFVVKLVEDVRDGRGDFTAGELFSAASPAILPLILNGLLRGLAVTLGLILLIIPGLFLLTIWAVTSPAIVAERQGVFDAFRRSQELVRGDGWQVFITIVLVFLITVGVTFVALLIGAGLGVVGLIILAIIASTLTAPIGALVSSVLFFDLGGGSTAAVAAPAAPAQPAAPTQPTPPPDGSV
jgi:hypothetical protein